jgi:hypothetical protein
MVRTPASSKRTHSEMVTADRPPRARRARALLVVADPLAEEAPAEASMLVQDLRDSCTLLYLFLHFSCLLLCFIGSFEISIPFFWDILPCLHIMHVILLIGVVCFAYWRWPVSMALVLISYKAYVGFSYPLS